MLKAHRLLYHSTLGLKVTKKKRVWSKGCSPTPAQFWWWAEWEQSPHRTLNPTPSTLFTTPQIPHPNPLTPNPKPSILNPQPSTLNPQPSTLNPQPWAE